MIISGPKRQIKRIFKWLNGKGRLHSPVLFDEFSQTIHQHLVIKNPHNYNAHWSTRVRRLLGTDFHVCSVIDYSGFEIS